MSKFNFDFFIFNRNLKLEKFVVIKDAIDYDFEGLTETAEKFLK